jgi:hypothetical protein
VGGRFPAGEFGVDGFAFGEDFDVIGNVIESLFAVAIGDANFDRFEGIEAVDVGDRKLIDAVDHGGVAGGDGVEPSAAAGASSGGAEFAAHGVEHVGDFGVFGWEGAFADSGRVGFHDTDDAVHAVGWHAGAGAGAAGSGVRGGDEGIGAVVDVEKCSLSALEKNVGFATGRLVQVYDGVSDEGLECVAGGAVGVVDFFKRKRFATESFQDFVVFLDALFENCFEAFGIDEINETHADAGGFVTVRRADASFGGADFVFALEDFALGIEFAMVGKNQMRGFADEEVAVDVDAELEEALDFFDEGNGIDDDAVADDADFFAAQDAGGDEVEDVFFGADEDGVSGVVAALGADNDVGLFGENVDDFSLPFVTPLGPNQYCIRHSSCSCADNKKPRIVKSGHTLGIYGWTVGRGSGGVNWIPCGLDRAGANRVGRGFVWVGSECEDLEQRIPVVALEKN